MILTKKIIYKLAFAYFILVYFPPYEEENVYKAIPTIILLILINIDLWTTLFRFYKNIYKKPSTQQEV